MNKLIDWQSPNHIFYLSVCVIIVSVFIVAGIADKQNEHFLAQHQQYLKGASLVQAGNYNEALNLFKDLDRGFADSYQVLYLKGASYLQTKQYSKAALSLEQAQAQHPVLLKDPNFLYLCGEVYYLEHDYDKTRLYWEQSLKFAPDQNFKNKVQHLLNTVL